MTGIRFCRHAACPWERIGCEAHIYTSHACRYSYVTVSCPVKSPTTIYIGKMHGRSCTGCGRKVQVQQHHIPLQLGPFFFAVNEPYIILSTIIILQWPARVVAWKYSEEQPIEDTGLSSAIFPTSSDVLLFLFPSSSNAERTQNIFYI
jgi:hypothetical protein